MRRKLSRRAIHRTQLGQEKTIEELETVLVGFLNMPFYKRWCWCLFGWVPEWP